MTVLVTGGCGFIGSHIVRDLVRDGHAVRVLDDLSAGNRSTLPSGVEFIEGDIAEAGIFDAALEGVTQVFHLAAIASVERSRTDWLRCHAVNNGGMVNLLHSIAQRGSEIPVVYASSAAIYGNCDKLPIAEDIPAKPESAYGADKYGCELHGRVAAELHHIPNIGLRFFNVYGPGQDPRSPYSGVISIFMDRAIKGEALTIFGNGQQSRDFVYVDDVVRTMRAAMGKLTSGSITYGVYNVGTGKAVSITKLAEHIRDLSGKDIPIRYAPARQGEIMHSYCDNRRAVRELDYTPACSLDHGLTLTYESVRD